MKNLILLRGLPGAGKTYLAYLIWTTIFEADKFFEKDGEYKFDAAKLPEAHAWCKSEVENAMKQNALSEHLYPEIVVCNTFTREWEMEEYFKLASKYNYNVVSLIVENRHGNKNIHNVPHATLEKMKNRFEIKLC